MPDANGLLVYLNDVLEGWIYDPVTHKVSIPLSSIDGLTALEADPITGDSRKIAFSLMEKFWNHNIYPPDWVGEIPPSSLAGIGFDPDGNVGGGVHLQLQKDAQLPYDPPLTIKRYAIGTWFLKDATQGDVADEPV